MFNLPNLRFTWGGLHGDVSCNLSTLVRTGGGRLNECKSDEGRPWKCGVRSTTVSCFSHLFNSNNFFPCFSKVFTNNNNLSKQQLFRCLCITVKRGNRCLYERSKQQIIADTFGKHCDFREHQLSVEILGRNSLLLIARNEVIA